ncbi:MAG: hypothetical protein WAO61_05690 [Solirubrobacterales bacterium]
MLVLVAGAAFALLSAAAGPAAAFTWPAGASLVSGTGGSGSQSSDAVQFPAVSGDGKFAVFTSTSGSLSPDAPYGGLFRRSLTDPAAPLEVVAKLLQPIPGPPPVQCGVLGRSSISENGRYVAFSSGENGLVAGDSNDFRDVFIRDMSIAAGAPGAYRLVSAADGGATGAVYSLPTDNDVDGAPIPAIKKCTYGATLPESSGSAISDDGSKVLFTNSAFTDLFADAGTTTAPGQLFVRDTAAQPAETILVTSVAYDVLFGTAPGPEPSQEVGDPLADPEFFDTGGTEEPGTRKPPQASLSGDGSTVVWNGMFARNQVKYHRAEMQGINFPYQELGTYNTYTLMWRRIADGAAAQTRRVSGRVDLDDPACDHNLAFEIEDIDPAIPAQAACMGPFGDEVPGRESSAAPAVSDDGRFVYFLEDASVRGDDSPSPLGIADLFVSDMTTGVSRKAGLQEVTRGLAGHQTLAALAASGDGKRVVVTTTRRDFSSRPSLNEILPFPDTGANKAMLLFEAASPSAFATASVEWIGRPHTGTTATAGIGSFSLDNDGDTVVFSAENSGHFVGQNSVAQAMCVRKAGTSSAPCIFSLDAPVVPPGQAPPPAIGNPFVPRPPVAATLELLSIKPLASGRASIPVKVSLAGSIKAKATAKLPKGRKLKNQTAATAAATAAVAGTVDLALKLNSAAKRYLKKKGKLGVNLVVTFTSATGATVEATRKLTFKLAKKKKK